MNQQQKKYVIERIENIATLKIKSFKPKFKHSTTEMREKVLKTLVFKSPNVLKAECTLVIQKQIHNQLNPSDWEKERYYSDLALSVSPYTKASIKKCNAIIDKHRKDDGGRGEFITRLVAEKIRIKDMLILGSVEEALETLTSFEKF